MNDGGEVSASRTVALLKEAAITEAEQRSAAVTLADRALIAADGDGQAAADLLREVLEIAGLIDYESVQPKRRISNKPIHDRRPGQ